MSPCDRCDKLHEEMAFWRDQYKLAAAVAATLADLNDYDQRIVSLRQLLRGERVRREQAEHEATVLAYKLAQLIGENQ